MELHKWMMYFWQNLHPILNVSDSGGFVIMRLGIDSDLGEGPKNYCVIMTEKPQISISCSRK